MIVFLDNHLSTRKWTMDSKGNFHKGNVLRENSPHYDESIANDTHIPFTP